MLNLPGKTFDREAVPVWGASDYLRKIAAERRARLERMGARAWHAGVKFGPPARPVEPFGPKLSVFRRAQIEARLAERAKEQALREAENAEKQQVNSADAFKRMRYVRSVITEAARQHGIPADWIIGDMRFQPVVRARHWAIWEIARTTGLSLPQIGRVFGGKDHTTILHAIRRENERQGASVRVKTQPPPVDLPAIPTRVGA